MRAWQTVRKGPGSESCTTDSTVASTGSDSESIGAAAAVTSTLAFTGTESLGAAADTASTLAITGPGPKRERGRMQHNVLQ